MNKNILNLKIFIDADDSIKIPWKIKRDISKRGYTIEKIIKQIESRKEDYIKYILPQKKEADIIIFYYGDSQFDLNNFDINEPVNYKYKIGINKNFNNLSKLLNNLDVSNIINDDDFYFFSCDNLQFETAIQNLIISFMNL
jgi:uridine kinase